MQEFAGWKDTRREAGRVDVSGEEVALIDTRADGGLSWAEGSQNSFCFSLQLSIDVGA